VTLNDQALAYIRTIVPYGIGLAVVWLLVHTGVAIPEDVHASVVALAIALVTVVYYAVIRILETRVPWLGVLLGWPRRPDYPNVANLWASVVRTSIPAVAAALVVVILSLIASAAGITVTVETQAQLVLVVVGVLETGYYSAAKWITTKWPAALWLLGDAPAPVYAPALTRA